MLKYKRKREGVYYDYTQLENITGDYEIISSDEIEEYLKRKGEQNYEKK